MGWQEQSAGLLDVSFLWWAKPLPCACHSKLQSCPVMVLFGKQHPSQAGHWGEVQQLKGGRSIGDDPRFILDFMVLFCFIRLLQAVNCELWIYQC